MSGRPESGGKPPPEPTPIYRLVHVDNLPTLLRRAPAELARWSADFAPYVGTAHVRAPRRACSVEAMIGGRASAAKSVAPPHPKGTGLGGGGFLRLVRPLVQNRRPTEQARRRQMRKSRNSALRRTRHASLSPPPSSLGGAHDSALRPDSPRFPSAPTELARWSV